MDNFARNKIYFNKDKKKVSLLSNLVSHKTTMKALFVVLVAFIIGAIAVPPCYEIYGNLPAPLPGVNLIGLGYDTVNDKPALCVIKLTYSGDTITSPYDNKTYSIPDGVQTIKTPDTFNTTTNTVSNNNDILSAKIILKV